MKATITHAGKLQVYTQKFLTSRSRRRSSPVSLWQHRVHGVFRPCPRSTLSRGRCSYSSSGRGAL